MALVLRGAVVSFDPGVGTLDDAAVYISDDDAAHQRKIEAVLPWSASPPAGYAAAPRVHTGGTIYPGLIDLHNHLAYNCRSLWLAPRTEPYETRYQWPRAANYSREITKPTVALGTAAAKAVLKFAEVKAVVGGVTSIQGSPKTTKPYEGWLVRNIEAETFGTGRDVVCQSVMNLDQEELKPFVKKMGDGKAFIYHLAEGASEKLVSEFQDVKAVGGLHELLIGIHSTALTYEQFKIWGETGGSIVWSPFSNLWLYRKTTDVVSARDNGIIVCLGSDWGPSGTKNLLGELKVAHLYNRQHLDKSFSDEELCSMATANAGEALGRAWGPQVGRVAPGLQADLIVVARRTKDPYRNLIEATERHIRLVLVGGRPTYGNRLLMEATGARRLEKIRVAGSGTRHKSCGSRHQRCRHDLGSGTHFAGASSREPPESGGACTDDDSAG